MQWHSRLWLLVLAVILSSVGTPALAQQQVACGGGPNRAVDACALGMPDAHGVTLRAALDDFGQTRSYQFEVGPDVRTGYIYVGDLWYELSATLVRQAPAPNAPADSRPVAEVRVGERRTIQFVRPALIVERLEPGTYTLTVRAANPDTFTPQRGFTVRVALGPPACALQQDPAALYQLSLSYEPQTPTAFSLLSLTAFVTPPYSDLFDFDWQVDGQPVAGRQRETLQLAVGDLAAAPNDEHSVRVTARGVRTYPDPDPVGRHVPPTLSVECKFRAAGDGA
jgi:hypothetical protein